MKDKYDSIAEDLRLLIAGENGLSRNRVKEACNLSLILRDKETHERIGFLDIERCREYYFIYLFPIYIFNLEGQLPSYDHEGEIPEFIRRKHIDFIYEFERRKIEEYSDKSINHDEVIKTLKKDALKLIAKQKQLLTKRVIGRNLFEYLMRSIWLSAFYAESLVKDFFDEYQYMYLEFITKGGKLFRIDASVYAHIFMNHYVPHNKQMLMKSIISDKSISPREMPIWIGSSIVNSLDDTQMDAFPKTLNMYYNSQLYRIRFEGFILNKQGRPNEERIRMTTFHPANSIKAGCPVIYA